MANGKTQEKLRERIKELTCLYDVTTAILQHSDSVEATLAKVTWILKSAYKHSDSAVVELALDTMYTLTDHVLDSVFQEAPIKLEGIPVGYIRVHYPKALYSSATFLDEETLLLQKVAVEVSAFYEKVLSKEKQQVLEKGLQRADRLAVLGEITAGIAHELNTPLGNILGFAELIKEQVDEMQVKDDIEKIIAAAIHSREIVKKLMFFSCEMPQHLQVLEITNIIAEALALLGPNFKRKNISVKYIPGTAQQKAKVDAVQFTQVIFNIVLNAIYASPVHSTVLVQVRQDVDSVVIEVSDCGEGIPDPIKPKIFEPFFTTKPLGEGTGLGLSVVHGIIKSHRGEIYVSDNTPKGTVFTIYLPKIST